ncbi:MAG: hypothetical protein OXD49_02645 [Candidatus Poribacteria bacterium]|nr:hypothetical protein [Candidatus Poribacteria bacterium]
MFRTTPEATYFFTEVEHDILKSVCAYMVGVTADTALDTSVIVIDTFVQQVPKALRRQLRFGLHLFQWGPPLFIGKLCRFTQLDPRDAVRYIEGWAKSRFKVRRRLFRGLRDIAFLGFYSNQPSETISSQ